MWIQTDLEKEEAVESRKELTTTNSHTEQTHRRKCPTKLLIQLSSPRARYLAIQQTIFIHLADQVVSTDNVVLVC